MGATPGFDAAHLILEASIDRFGALPTVATALGNVAAAGFLLWAFQRAFLSQARQGGHDVDKTLPMEYVVCGIALAAMLAIGAIWILAQVCGQTRILVGVLGSS